MPNESTQTLTPTECEHGQDEANADCPVCAEKTQTWGQTYISNWGKEREKPRDKMRRRAEDK